METIEYKNTNLDKTLWGTGVWDEEPDKKQWQDMATELPCLVVRNYSGALCGYVGVPSSHPLYGKDDNEVDIEVHGGLTFSGKCQEGREECSGVCYKASQGEDDVWWLGFDCCHYRDLTPTDFGRHDYVLMREEGACYRDFSYVISEVENLARQLKEYA